MRAHEHYTPERFAALMEGFLDPSPAEAALAGAGEGPRISVVMPCFNAARFLERSLLSVLRQDYPNRQIILIDGGSTDGTLDVVRRYRDRLDHFVSEPDGGQSDALNKGFRAADGDIFCWLNADDILMPGALRAAAEAFAGHPEAQVVFGDWITIDAEDRLLSYEYAFDFDLGHFVYEGFTMNSQACFWRKEVHRRFGEFSEDLHRTMDYEMLLRFGVNEGPRAFLRLPTPLACFRRHEQQKTRGTGSMVVLDEHARIARRTGFGDKLARRSIPRQLRYRLRRAYWYAKRGGIGYMLGKLRGARLLPSFIKRGG